MSYRVCSNVCLQGITNRLTSLEEAIASTAIAAGDSVERQDVLQGQTERNADSSPTSLVGQSSESVLHSQTGGKTISTTEAQDNTPPTKKSEPMDSNSFSFCTPLKNRLTFSLLIVNKPVNRLIFLVGEPARKLDSRAFQPRCRLLND